MKDSFQSALHELENSLRLGQETAEATAFVMQKRLEILAGAAADPLSADTDEIGLMGTEKVEAFTASALAANEAACTIGQSYVEMVQQQSTRLTANLDALSSAPDEATRLAMQTEQIALFWGQAIVDGMQLWSDSLSAQNRIIEPVHAAVTANAERLK